MTSINWNTRIRGPNGVAKLETFFLVQASSQKIFCLSREDVPRFCPMLEAVFSPLCNCSSIVALKTNIVEVWKMGGTTLLSLGGYASVTARLPHA